MHVPGNVIGTYEGTPEGIIIHGTRSGQGYSINREYTATLNYVAGGAAGLGWLCTIGDGVLAWHMNINEWGWNAREHSSKYIGVEVAQAKLGDTPSDAQIEGIAYVWTRCKSVWPAMPLRFVNHSDLPAGIRDGKTDIEPRGKHATIDRVLSRLYRAGYR